MAFLKWAAALAMCGCVNSELEQPADQSPPIINTCIEAAEFGVTCGVYPESEVKGRTAQCETFGNEIWTTCAIRLRKAVCAAVAQCAKPADKGDPDGGLADGGFVDPDGGPVDGGFVDPDGGPFDGGMVCEAGDDCRVGESCLNGICQKNIE